MIQLFSCILHHMIQMGCILLNSHEFSTRCYGKLDFTVVSYTSPVNSTCYFGTAKSIYSCGYAEWG